MKKYYLIYILSVSILIFVLNSNLHETIQEQEKIYNISEIVYDSYDHKKASFEFSNEDKYLFFKYDYINNLSTSKVISFRIEFDQFNANMNYQVFCTNVDNSISDLELMETLKSIKNEESSCIDGLRSYGKYDSIVKLDENKSKLGIILIPNLEFEFSGAIYLSETERLLGAEESKIMVKETYSLVPFIINLQKFRDLEKTKILFYSNSRILQMFHVESDIPYPEKLFSGNV